MANHYLNQRARVIPPYASLRVLRKVSGMTLDEVCALANASDSELTLTRGALSGIENGHRGASVEVIAALEVAYDIEPGSLDTKYEPRKAPVAA